jgi:hypothetical protein
MACGVGCIAAVEDRKGLSLRVSDLIKEGSMQGSCSDSFWEGSYMSLNHEYSDEE